MQKPASVTYLSFSSSKNIRDGTSLYFIVIRSAMLLRFTLSSADLTEDGSISVGHVSCLLGQKN